MENFLSLYRGKRNLPKINIRVIVFDLGKVVLNFDIQRAINRFMKASKIPFMKIQLHFFVSSIAHSYERGEITSKEFYDSARDILGVKMNEKTFWEYWNDIFWDNPGMEELLSRLSVRYPLYLLSNTNEKHFDYIEEKYPIMRYFKRVFPSHRMGFRKPEKHIYLKVLEQIKCAPEEAVFIDDIPRNVRAARRCGLHTVQYRGNDQLIRSLKRFGVCVA